MMSVTSPRISHRELVALLLVAGSIFVAAGTADAAVSTTSPSSDGAAGIGYQSVP
jgi:hypothetical protein